MRTTEYWRSEEFYLDILLVVDCDAFLMFTANDDASGIGKWFDSH